MLTRNSANHLVLCLLLCGFVFGESKYIVVFKDHPSKQALSRRPEFAAARSFNILPALAVQLDRQQLEILRNDNKIDYIEPDYPISNKGFKSTDLDSTPISASTSMQSIPYGVDMIGAVRVWPMTMGEGAVVAVLDTGIMMFHPDRGNVIASASFISGEDVEDFDGHGTHASGTVAAVDNDIGVVGVAPEADLLIGKVLDNTGHGFDSDLIAGIEWAVQNGADVISMSLGGPDYSASLETACNNAYANNVLLVAAAGNDNTSLPHYPANYSSVISVSAVDQFKQKASFSNFGPTVELAAPGVNVLSTVSVDDNATGNAVWSATSHQSNVMQGTAAGTISGQICNCGLATGLTEEDTCPDSVAGNIAHIRRGDIFFSEKVAHAQSKGALGVIISNNIPDNFQGTLGAGSPLIVVTISQADGDELQLLAESEITGSVSVNANLYDYFSGTSMASPHVAGAAALIFSAQEDISASLVRNILIYSAEDLGNLGRDSIFGYGLVNADAAVSAIGPHILSVYSRGARGVLINSTNGQGGTSNYNSMVNGATTVTLTAPAVWGGRTFANWSGAVNSPNLTIDLTMIADMSVTANYVRSATPASTVFVDLIYLRTMRGSPGWSYGYATVKVLDNCGDPVAVAEVMGTFSGDYTETLSSTTNAHGIAIFTTTTQVENPVYTFCIDDIGHATLTYNPGDNAETCDSY